MLRGKQNHLIDNSTKTTTWVTISFLGHMHLEEKLKENLPYPEAREEWDQWMGRWSRLSSSS